MNTKITNISVKRADASGSPYISSYTNKEQAKVGIQVDTPEFSGKWLSAFVELGNPIEQWKVGQIVDIIVTQKGNFWNFKVARGVAPVSSSGEKLMKEIDDLKKRLLNLENWTGYSEYLLTGNRKVEDAPPF